VIMKFEEITHKVIGCAMEVHKYLCFFIWDGMMVAGDKSRCTCAVATDYICCSFAKNVIL